MRDSDVLSRFVFEHAPVRGEIVHLDASFRAILERRTYPEPIRTVLGEFMAAATLLAATLKFDGRLILQIQGGGPLTLLVVECTSDHTLRAVAHWDEAVSAPSLDRLVGDGRLVITVEPSKGEERYQGIVNLEGATVAQAVERYYAQSEQVETRVWLACSDTCAAGLLLQRLPGAPEDEDLWPRAVELTSTLTASELLTLPPAEVLRRLYHEEDIRLFTPVIMSFRCSCGRERVEAVLHMLGREDIENLLAEQGSVSVDCEFCGKHYVFDAVDVEQLFVTSPVSSAPARKH
jgi:molecular chaperone Hsp33